jgi:hypothetical protein
LRDQGNALGTLRRLIMRLFSEVTDAFS